MAGQLQPATEAILHARNPSVTSVGEAGLFHECSQGLGFRSRVFPGSPIPIPLGLGYTINHIRLLLSKPNP